MSMKKREMNSVKNYGFRKTPSTDLSVVPDRDTSSMPLESDLLLRADGNENKITMSVGRHNHDQDIPAIHFGLSQDRIGSQESRALDEIQSRLVAGLAQIGATSELTGESGIGNCMTPLATVPEGIGLSMANVPYRAYPVDFSTFAQPDNALVFDANGDATGTTMDHTFNCGIVAEHILGGNHDFVRAPVQVGGCTVRFSKHSDMRNKLGWHILGESFVNGANATRAVNNRTVNAGWSAQIPVPRVANFDENDPGAASVTVDVSDLSTVIDEAMTVSPTSWHTRMAESMIQTRGDYIRNNARVLRDLAANMHKMIEYESTGLFARGFRSNLWSKHSEDEIRVLGEMMHLGTSLMYGYPIRNRHLSAAMKGSQRTDSTAVTEIITRLIFRYDDSSSNSVAGDNFDGVAGLIEAAYGIPAADLESHYGAAGTRDQVGFIAIDVSSLDTDGSYMVGNVANTLTPGVEINYTIRDYDASDAFTEAKLVGRLNAGTTNSPDLKYVNLELASIAMLEGLDFSTKDARNAILDTASADGLPSVTSVTGALGINDTAVHMANLQLEGSVSPFFLHVERCQHGPMRMALDHELNEGREAGMHNEGFFACVPGLEEYISLAHVVEGELVQPESRDIMFESFWHGISWLFGSDNSERVGRHWGSVSKLIRDISPDFKAGKVHDLRAKSSRTDSDVLKAAYLLGHSKIDEILLRDADPVNSATTFFATTGNNVDRVNLIDLYDTRGFVNDESRQEFVAQVEDLAKRNVQTTNDFIAGQQAVGDASTTVYHRQSPDGGEHSVKLNATLMSFGAFDHLAPTIVTRSGTRLNVFRNFLLDSSDGSSLPDVPMQDLVNEFVARDFPRTKDWQTVNQHDGFDYNIHTQTFVQFDWSQSWEGLRTLCRSSNPGLTYNRETWYTANTGPRVVTLSRASAATSVPSTIGQYFLELSIDNPLYKFMGITSEVYNAFRTNIGAQPYQSKIQMADVIDINLVKQVTLSAGSPALQQLLESFMVYGLRNVSSGGGRVYSLQRLALARRLWDRRQHPRDTPYTRNDHSLFPFVLTGDMSGGEIPNLVSNLNVFLYDLGYAGYSDLYSGPVLSPGMVRTQYVNMINPDGTVYDHAITLPGEAFNFLVLGNADTEFGPVSTVQPASQLTGLSEFLPGFRHHGVLFGNDTGTNPAQAFPYCWTNPETFGTVTGVPERYTLNLRPGFLENQLQLPRQNKFRELPTQILPSIYGYRDGSNVLQIAAAVETSAGSGVYQASAVHTAIPIYAMIDGVVVSIAPDSGGNLVTTGNVRQIADNVRWYTSASAARGHTTANDADQTLSSAVVFPDLSEFNLDVIGAISGLARQNVDDALLYHTRRPKTVFVCQDTFDIATQIQSQLLHMLGGQRIVGPTSYLVEYDHLGNIATSLREVYTTVGSGQKITGTPSAKAAPSDVVASDGDEPSGDDSDDYTAEDGE